jgi:hypothetical protein
MKLRLANREVDADLPSQDGLQRYRSVRAANQDVRAKSYLLPTEAVRESNLASRH